MNILTKDEIKEKVIAILNKVKNESECYIEENFDKPLTGKDFKYSSTDMVYLLMELMEEFHIKFTKEDIENYRFNTINNITDIISKKC